MAREVNGPDAVVIWCPPAGEHELARSLHLAEHDRATTLDWVRAVRAEFQTKGVRVRVLRCRCWRVVRALQLLGLTNTSENRAAAYGFLLKESDRGEAEQDENSRDATRRHPRGH